MANGNTQAAQDATGQTGTAFQPDMSTLSPLARPATAPAFQPDMSTLKPIGGNAQPEKPYNPEEHGALSRFGHAFAEPFVSAYHGITDKPEDVNEVIAHANGGPGGLVAYRAAKKLMEAHDAMAKAKPGPAFRQAVSDFQNAAVSLVLGNKYDALMHGVSGGLSTMGAASPDLQGALARPRELSEGAASGGDLATPLGSTAADVAIGAATYGAGRGLSAIRGAAQAGEAAEEAGAAGRATEAATAPKPAPKPGIVKQIVRGEKVAQPQAEEALRTGAKAGGAEAGASTVQPQSLRTVVEQPINAIETHAKELYKTIDEATGGKFQPNADRLANVNNKLRDIAGTDEAKEAELTATKQRLEWQQEQLFDKAAENGIPKDIVQSAKADFKQAQALRDLESKVFKNPSVIEGNAAMGAPETVNVKAAVKALQKLQDSTEFGGPRLEQALGKEGANGLLKDMYAAQKAGVTAMTRQQFAIKLAKYSAWASLGAGIVREAVHAVAE